jgi:hypothetical protein
MGTERMTQHMFNKVLRLSMAAGALTFAVSFGPQLDVPAGHIEAAPVRVSPPPSPTPPPPPTAQSPAETPDNSNANPGADGGGGGGGGG